MVCEVRRPKEALSDEAELKGAGVEVKSGSFRHLRCVASGSFSPCPPTTSQNTPPELESPRNERLVTMGRKIMARGVLVLFGLLGSTGM